MMNKKTFLKFTWVAGFIPLIVYWWLGSGTLALTDTAGLLIALGRIAGLGMTYLLLSQLLFIGRIPLIEQTFGHDGLNNVHRKLGYFLVFAIVVHPLLLTAGWASKMSVSMWSQYVDFLTNWEDVAMAAAGIAILIIAGIVSLPWIKRLFVYDVWHAGHMLMYLGVLLTLPHQNTADVAAFPVLFSYWVFLIVATGLSVSYYRFGRPLLYYWKYHFAVSRIMQESADTYSVYITGKNISHFSFQPGQFANFLFLTPNLWWRPHPYSFSCVPGSDLLRITIKALGKATAITPSIPTGTRVIIDGPLGLFTRSSMITQKALLVAGGIGITPLRSLAEELHSADIDTAMLYAAKTRSDLVFENELRDIGISPICMLSGEKDVPTPYCSGFFAKDNLATFVPDIVARDIFMCGPKPMMESLEKCFLEMGVPREQIHYEKFSY